jgi:hypothetical protein
LIRSSKFGEDEIISMFYAYGLHILCAVPMSVIHPIVGSIMLVETIMVVKWNVHLAERVLHGNKVNFINPTTNFYAMSAQKLFYAS